MNKRVIAACVAMAMLIGLIEVVAPGGAEADPVSKSLVGNCTGADAPSNTLLAALGSTSLPVSFTIDADVPKSLTPNQSGSTIAFTWKVGLSTDLVNTAVKFNVNSLTIRNTRVDVAVAGPTTTTGVAGRPTDRSIALAANTPATISVGPFTGKLNGVGDSGVITYKTGAIGFTISVPLGGGQNINIACNAPGLIASTPIKVPGAPNIAQPIEVKGAAGAAVTLDVLGKYVTAGRTPVVPSSLRVVNGKGSVKGGRLVINAGGAPSANSVTFEVCGDPLSIAPPVAGTSEVQHLSLFKGTDLLKKSIGFTLKYDGQETAPIWTAKPNLLGTGLTGTGPLAKGMPTTKPTNWPNRAGDFALWTDPVMPAAATLRTALEQLPNIGAGNVAVTRTAAGEYDIAFQGALANRNVSSIALGEYWSNLPQESLGALLAAAGSLSPDPSVSTTTTTIPAGLTTNDYIIQLLLQGRTDEAGKVLSGAILGGIDVQATLAGLTQLFPAKPNASTSADGVDPVPEQFQDLCSQGSATVTVPAPPAPPATVAPAAPAVVLPAFTFAAPVAPKAAASLRCRTVRKRVRVRIRHTKRYRTVTKRVTVCSKAKATAKKKVVHKKVVHKKKKVTKRTRTRHTRRH